MRLLELFSGTHSIGKVAKQKGYEIISLDRDLGEKCPFGTDYISDTHIKEDIMKWDYKQYPVGYFEIITASPVCIWWSPLRRTWIGRKCKSIHPTDIITKEHIDNDIEIYGKPMVDKVFEIIDYFKPKYWWVENPSIGRMKEHIKDKPYYDVDYCKYSDWGYKKKTRFWTNIKGFKPKLCKDDCVNGIVVKTKNKVKYFHKTNLALPKYVEDKGEIIKVDKKELRTKYKDYESINNKKIFGNQKSVFCGNTRLERYRIPEKLIVELLEKIN